MKCNYNFFIINKCTCGRKERDIKDLACILEYHKKNKLSMGNNSSLYSDVVCLRTGCLGRWRTDRKYIDKIPLITLNEWQKLKKENRDFYTLIPNPAIKKKR